MLVPPVLEIYVVWHPGDALGTPAFEAILDHFHGTTFSGLVGGAVEVYVRCEGWEGPGAAPRPMPFMEPYPNGIRGAAIIAVVPVLGTHLARAAEQEPKWREYLKAIVASTRDDPNVGVFGLPIDTAAVASGTELARIFGSQQGLDVAGATDPAVLCRDLAHSIAGLIGDPMGDRLRVFISHTKRLSALEEPDAVQTLVHLVRDVIGNTHLAAFFDQADLQPGEDWERELSAAAATSGLLVVRTDLFAGRDWCQREVLVAKRADMPVVVLQALRQGEERGSFLMDHVPAVPLHAGSEALQRESIEAALNQLVDEALKRALWRHQRAELEAHGFDWLPANAPEPVTLIPWLASIEAPPTSDDRKFVLHPDPPLGRAEMEVIDDLLRVAGIPGLVEILTPRTFSSRGGWVSR